MRPVPDEGVKMGAEISAHIPFAVIGLLVGLFAFVPLMLALLPVLRHKREADMIKGTIGVIASFVTLVAGVAVVFALAKTSLVAMTAGELVGFFVGLIAIACVAIVV